MQRFVLESMLFIYKSQKSVWLFSRQTDRIDGFVRIKECEKRTVFVAPFFLFELNWIFFLRIRLHKLYFVF